MNFEQLYSTAASEAGYLIDADCTKLCVSAAVFNASAADMVGAIRKELHRQNLDAKITRSGPMGCYDLEPALVIEKPGQPGIMYGNVTPAKVKDLVDAYLAYGDPRPDLAFCTFGNDNVPGIPSSATLPFFSLQKRLVTGNCGFIDPGNINHYIVRGKGYSGLAAALETEPSGVIDRLRQSGAADQANKWQSCHEAAGQEKYLVCNAVDADPRSLTARLLLRGDPHAVLEGMLISAYAIGAGRCFICVATDDSHDIETIHHAIEQMKVYGLVGPGVLGSGFGVDIEVREVERRLVSAEETALLRALEGRQARPYLIPGGAALRYLDAPVLVDNIEIFANIACVFREEGKESGGTKIITLTDGMKNLTVEIPFGTTLRALVEDIGERLWDRGEIQAVQLGGGAGAFFPAGDLDVPISCKATCPGVVVIFRHGMCPVDMAREAAAYLQGESCGQCVFCREGSLQMSEILTDIVEFKGAPGDLELLEELGDLIKEACICGLGSAAPNPVLSSLRHFRRDYDAHIKEKRCLEKGQ